MFVTNSLYRQTTVGYWFCTFATNSFSWRTVVQINLCPPRSVPCATRHANLPASTKPPRHRGDCAKGARKVFSQAATGRHPLQSSCNPRRAKHIKPHTVTFTHRSFYTRKLLHTEAFTHRGFYTQTLLHTDATILHTNAFTHRHLYTQRLLHTVTFTHRSF